MPEAATSTPVLSALPSTSGAQQTSASVESGVGGLVGGLSSLNPGDPNSPLASVAGSLGQLSAKLNFNPEPLRKLYPDALYVMQNALPADSIERVRSIEEAYRQAQDFLKDSALAREIKPGATLQDVALAAVRDALRLFDERQLLLHQNIIDAGTLEDVRAALAAFARFRDDFEGNAADFLPFISRHLFGLGPELLKEPLARLEVWLGIFDPLDRAALDNVLRPAQEAVDKAFRELAELIETFDAADPAAYVKLEARLSALDAAVRVLYTALDLLYSQLQLTVGAHDWGKIFPELRGLLAAVTFRAPPTVDDAIHALSVLFDRLVAGLHTVVLPQEIVERAESMCKDFYDLFASSAVGQVRRVLREFLEKIQQALASVPTEEVQKSVEEMLARVRQEIDALGLGDLAKTIEQGFQDAEKFITENINETLKEDVGKAVEGLLDGLRNLPVKTLFADINTAIQRVQELLNELDASLAEGVNDVKAVLARLEELSFAPVGDAVISEIDDLKQRVKAMNPNALSDPEKLAIKTALAFLEGFDLESIIEREAVKGFNKAKDSVKPLLDELAAVLKRLRDQLEAYNPTRFVGALTGLLDEAQKLADRLDANVILWPLFQQADELVRRLESLSPGSLLDPLAEPYKDVVSAVDQLRPERLIAPLNALYKEVDRLIDVIDITPVLEELDRRQKELFRNASAALLSALDRLDLPSPLKEFFAEVRPVAESFTEAVFGDPDKEIERVSHGVPRALDITGVFKPLDAVFDKLMGMTRGVPADDLVTAFETLRKAFGPGFDSLDPRRLTATLRRGQRGVEEISPQRLFSQPLSLPALRVTFEARVSAAPAARKEDVKTALLRFDAVIKLTSPAVDQSLFADLSKGHKDLSDAVRARINSLDAAGAEAAYGKLRDQLAKVLPEFLQGDEPLTHADVMAGLERLRPSRKAGELQRVFARFQRQLAPMQAAVEEAAKKFFKAIRDTLDLVNPLSLKGAVADIHQTLREKVRILDPEMLAASLRASIFEPVENALKALDPAALKARLDEAYQKVLKALVDNVRPILKRISDALDEQLALIREEVKKILDDLKQTIGQAKAVFDGMVKKVEDLVFVEVLERLRRVLDNLGVSFEKELARVRKAFDQMLAALPLDIGPKKVSASASV